MDSPLDINKSFIKETIEEAVEDINHEISENTDESNELLVLDHDTKDTPGSPPITDTILKKIDNCSVLIPDLTFVAWTKENPETGKIKPVSNPNVLIEYGYAYKTKGHERIIGVMNTAFGEPSTENMYFNIRHMRFPVKYKLEPGSSEELKIEVRNDLKNQLISQLKLILKLETNRSGGLSVEVLSNRSSFYVRKNLKKILIIVHLKINNISERSVNVDVEKLEIEIERNWYEAIRSTFAGETIDTNKARVNVTNLDHFVPKDQTFRLDEFDSKPACFAYELDIRDFQNLVVDSETLSIRGQAKSLDGRTANFSGVITGY